MTKSSNTMVRVVSNGSGETLAWQVKWTCGSVDWQGPWFTNQRVARNYARRVRRELAAGRTGLLGRT